MNKLPIAKTFAAIAVIGGIAGSVVAVEDRYAKQTELVQVAQNTQQLMIDFRIENTRTQLNRLVNKRAAGQATLYDKEAIKQLERELDRLYATKGHN